jgi:hypothetical protein
VIDIALIPVSDCSTTIVLVDVVLSSGTEEWVHAVDLAFGWNPKKMRLIGFTEDRSEVESTMTGVPGLSMPLMPWDFYGVNQSLSDGDAYMVWLGPLTGAADPQLIRTAVIGTLVFERIDGSKSTVEILETVTHDAELHTSVFAGYVPGLDLFGTGFDARIPACAEVVQ